VFKRRGRMPFLWVSIGALALAVSVYVALRMSITNEAAATRDSISEGAK